MNRRPPSVITAGPQSKRESKPNRFAVPVRASPLPAKRVLDDLRQRIAHHGFVDQLPDP